MSVEANKAVVRKYVELWSTGNLALADEVLAADFVDHTHPEQAPGPEDVKQAIKAFREGFSDACITIEQMIGEGDTVAFRFVMRGTHRGTFAGFPPTGKEAVLNGMDFVRIAGGKMVELWSSQSGYAELGQTAWYEDAVAWRHSGFDTQSHNSSRHFSTALGCGMY